MLFRQPQAKGPTQEEKIAILERKLAEFFANHDKVSNEVNLYPLTRAKQEVEKMVREGSLDYHFEWFLLQEDYLKKVTELQARYFKQGSRLNGQGSRLNK